MRNDANIKCVDNNHMYPLHHASKNNHFAVTKELLQNGADVNCKDDQKWTPLNHALQENNIAITILLIRNGADINFQCSNGWTPIMIAAFYGKTEFVKLFLEYNCDLAIKDKEKKTVLDWAKSKPFQEIDQLISQKCNRYSPLHSASQYGNLHTVTKLLQEVEVVQVLVMQCTNENQG